MYVGKTELLINESYVQGSRKMMHVKNQNEYFQPN
jgi:hypothetical protein